jgi:hypothetical protein
VGRTVAVNTRRENGHARQERDQEDDIRTTIVYCGGAPRHERSLCQATRGGSDPERGAATSNASESIANFWEREPRLVGINGSIEHFFWKGSRASS